ncbi:HERC1 [Symbiodinium sp. KB8]|nr:HERC1 [Symbiodinium sp. KB8]
MCSTEGCVVLWQSHIHNSLLELAERAISILHEELPKQTVIDEDAQVAPPESRRPSSTDERLPVPAPWVQRVLQGLAKEPRPRYRSKSQSSYEEAHLPPSELSKAETQPMKISTLEEVGGVREELPPINSSGARSMVSRDPKHSAQDLRILEAGHYAVKALAKHVDKAKELQKTLRRENRQDERGLALATVLLVAVGCGSLLQPECFDTSRARLSDIGWYTTAPNPWRNSTTAEDMVFDSATRMLPITWERAGFRGSAGAGGETTRRLPPRQTTASLGPIKACIMSMSVHVGLLSGHSCVVDTDAALTVGELRRKVQQKLQIGVSAFVDDSGQLLQEDQSLSEAGLQDGCRVTAAASSVKLLGSRMCKAFALLRPEGSVITWGAAGELCRGEMRNVEHIAASVAAFAAVQEDGKVVCSGEPWAGSDCSSVSEQLRHIKTVRASSTAFAALTELGTVVTWGSKSSGGDSQAVAEQLTGVVDIVSSWSAFAAIREDGSLVTWGDVYRGGDSRPVQKELRNVCHVAGTLMSFAALRKDGSVVTWGEEWSGGDNTAVTDALQGVQTIVASSRAFAAITEHGRVITWGDVDSGGCCNSVQPQLFSICQVCATDRAFAALRTDGRVICWGNAESGGCCDQVQSQLNNIRQMAGSSCAFAALRSDGTVLAWGDPRCGGDSSEVEPHLVDVVQIYASLSTGCTWNLEVLQGLDNGSARTIESVSGLIRVCRLRHSRS